MVYLLLADGFEEIEALLPLDILKRGGVEIRTVGITGKTVTGSHGVCVTADITADEAREDAEMVILPGGMPGAANLDASPAVDRLLDAAKKRGARMAAICAAPMVLGHRGLLAGKRAVCYPGFEKDLEGAIPCTERVVCDGTVTTAVGMGAAADLGFSLLSQLKGEAVAERVRRSALFVTEK